MSYDSEDQEYQATGAKLGKAVALGLGGLGITVGVIPAMLVGTVGGLAAYGIKKAVEESDKGKNKG